MYVVLTPYLYAGDKVVLGLRRHETNEIYVSMTTGPLRMAEVIAHEYAHIAHEREKPFSEPWAHYVTRETLIAKVVNKLGKLPREWK